MAHRTVLVLTVTCLCIGLALCAGCRKDLIDQTPVDEGEGLTLEVMPPEPGMAVEGETAEAPAEGAEQPEGAAEAQSAQAGGGARAGGSGEEPAPRRGGGAAAGAAGGGAARRGPAGAGAAAGERPRGGPARGDGERRGPIQRWDENGDGLLQSAEVPEQMREGFRQEPDTDLLLAVRRAHKELFGEELKLGGQFFGADNEFFINRGGIPAVCMGAGLGQSHSDHEYVDMPAVVNLARRMLLSALMYYGLA